MSYPFYHTPAGGATGELNRRANWYGARVRSGTTGDALSWSYGKIAYARISGGGDTLGLSYSKVMSNSKGELSLYDPKRNQPKYPLLQSVEITNEGALGSLIKGTFTFTIWPEVSGAGFSTGKVNGYFELGREISVSYGWSNESGGGNGGFVKGIISNFQWSINTDLSLTGTISFISKASVALGISGEQPAPNPTGGAGAEASDPAGKAVVQADLASIIEGDIAQLTGTATDPPSNPPTPPPPPPDPPPVSTVKCGETKSEVGASVAASNSKFTYTSIGVPMAPTDTAETTDPAAQTTPPNPPPTPANPPNPPAQGAPCTKVYYLAFRDIVQFVNTNIDKTPLSTIVDVDEPGTTDGGSKYPWLASCAPEKVLFPGLQGTYGPNFAPTYPTNFDGGQIGNILLSTDTIIDVYKKTVKENTTLIETKTLTSFFDNLAKEINYASGDVYQLTATLVDDPKGGKAKLKIEDQNVPTSVTASPFMFSATIAKPIIKSLSVVCKPPPTAAAAAFVGGKGGGGGRLLDVQHKQDAGAPSGAAIIKDLRDKFEQLGAGSKFTTDMKAAIELERRSVKGHWLNKILYPVEFSVTTDGVQGWQFGDAVDTNLLPTDYAPLTFCVTKISHTIKDGIWETTISTKARLPG